MTTETPPTDPKNAVPQEGAHTTGGESLYNQVTEITTQLGRNAR